MASLVILRDGIPLLRFRLEKEQTTIGRAPEVDLYIPDARVSRLHFLVRRDEDHYRLVDRSANGTLVNGAATRVANLKDQDLISVGGCLLRFDQASTPLSADTLMVPREGGALSFDTRLERFVYQRPVLRVLQAPPDYPLPPRLPIRLEAVHIGSGRSADVRLPGLAERHCQLLATEDNFILRPLEPRLPPIVNGEPVRQEIPIPYGTQIRLGATTLILELERGEDPLIPLQVPLFEGMVGTTPAMHKVFALLERFSRHDAPVVILGETGSGKELVARALHSRGHRARGPFVALNCSAITPQLFESELFGHVKGAFTGAVRDHEGAFEAANKGTLFLDELGELPLDLQAKLLRVLETSTVTPVGSHQAKPINVRVVAATHRNLAAMVESGRFRADLFYRLFVLSLEVPPLRARREDILPLALYFLEQLATGPSVPRLSPEAILKLEQHSWPGNIRELRHTLTRAVAGCSHRLIGEDELRFISMGPPSSTSTSPSTSPSTLSGAQTFPTPATPGQPWTVPPLHLGSGNLEVPRDSHAIDSHAIEEGRESLFSLEDLEKQAIINALRKAGQNRSEAARALGIARSTLHIRMRKHGLAGGEE